MVSKKSPIEIPWHAPSEQPYVVPDKALKRSLQRAALDDYLKALGTSLWFSPIIAARYFAIRAGHVPKGWAKPSPVPKEFLGFAVGLQSCPWQRLAEEIHTIGAKHILLRIPVWDLQFLQDYVDFIQAIPQCEVVVCIMQDREHIIDHVRWRRALSSIVAATWTRVKQFQIGQGSNRTKWAFFSMGEYLALAEQASFLRDQYEGIELIGPGVLDFELIPNMRALIHQFDINFDAIASALYVDRRGSPRNKQMGVFDLTAKIQALAAVAACATKSKRRLWITETNWPLKHQGEFSPTSENECVSEEDYDQFMQHYIIDAWKTQLVERVYWWQLVAKGYGLIDYRNGDLYYRPAYASFKYMLEAESMTAAEELLSAQ